MKYLYDWITPEIHLELIELAKNTGLAYEVCAATLNDKFEQKTPPICRICGNDIEGDKCEVCGGYPSLS